MLKFKDFLILESLPTINHDVNLLYDKFFRKDIEQFKKTGIITANMFIEEFTDSSILETSDSKRAHKLNPVQIITNNEKYSLTNFYKPSESIIGIGVNKQVKDLIKRNGSIEKVLEFLPDYQRESFKSEITEYRIKGSIHHELLHWLDDTFHNKHIEKYLKRVEEIGEFPSDMNAKYIEIQAQMGNIKELKNMFFEKWDEISFKEMINLSPSLKIISRNLSEEERKKWIRKLKKRMYRENLLGKNMT